MKQLTDSDYKQIIQRRDPRYDGRFYCGVTTTKIYCRPVCPARPKFTNIIIVKSPSAAEKDGYRNNIVSNALRLIEENVGGNQTVESLAQKLVDESLWQTNHSYLTHHIWNEFAQTLYKRKQA